MPRALGAVLVLAGVLGAAVALAQPADTTPNDGPPGGAATPSADAPALRFDAVLGRPGGLTSDQAAARAADSSLDARTRDAELRAAEAEVDRAAVGFFPRLQLVARYTRLSPIESRSLTGDASLVVTPAPAGPLPPGAPLIAAGGFSFPTLLDNYSLQASLTVPLSDYFLRLTQAYSAAARGRDAARLQAEAARLSAATDARVAYYSWARARLQVVVAERALAQARARERDVIAARETGRASRADVLRAESAVAAAELFVERASHGASLLETQLKTRLHDEESGSYEIGEDLLAPLPPLTPRKLEAMLQEALAQRPEVRALDESALSLRRQSASARGAGWPRLDAVGNVTHANPNSRFFPVRDEWNTTWDVSLQLTFSPNDLAAGGFAGAALESRAQALEAQRAALVDALRLEVQSHWLAQREADFAVRATARGLTAAEEAYRVRVELYRNGRGTATEVLEAETDLLRARLEHVNAHVDARIARARLDHALGRDAARLRRARR